MPKAGAIKPEVLGQSTQLMVVTTPSWSAMDGQLQRYERTDLQKAWQPVGRPISVVVGKSGMGWGIGVNAESASVQDAYDPVKKEGDGRSPAGVFTLGTAFGYAPQPLPGLRLGYLQLVESTECVDDVRSKSYNRVLDRSSTVVDWTSSEHMRDVGEAYRWGIVIDHNAIVPVARTPVSGGGSCVFLHIWAGAGHGTAGCTVMPQENLETLLTWIDRKRKPLLVQLPRAEYNRLMRRWKLPRLP